MNTTEPTDRGPGLLRVHAWLVLVAALLTIGAAGFYSASQDPTYTATAKVLSLATPTSGGGPPTAPDMGTEREVATSGEVAALAAQDLGTTPADARRPLSVSVITDTNVLTISYTASDSEQALAGASAFTRAFVDYRDSTQSARAARIITEPEIPEGAGPGLAPEVILVLATLPGLSLGVAAAWLWDRVSGRLRASNELASTGLPVLSTLTGGAEGPGHLAARLLGMTEHRRHGVQIVVTGTERSSPASRVAYDTATELAALGRRVVLVDADLHTAALSAKLNLPPGPVLVEVLTDGSSEAGVRATPVEGLRAISTTVRPSLSIDLDQWKVLMGQLTSHAIVVVSAPPAVEAPEAVLFMQQADVTLLVARVGTTQRTAVRQTASLALPTSVATAPKPQAGWVVCTTDYRSFDPARRSPQPPFGTEEGVVNGDSAVGSPP